jgi:hypothetical protein
MSQVAALGKGHEKMAGAPCLTSQTEEGKYPRSPFSYVNSVQGKNQYDGPKPFHRAIHGGFASTVYRSEVEMA